MEEFGQFSWKKIEKSMKEPPCNPMIFFLFVVSTMFHPCSRFWASIPAPMARIIFPSLPNTDISRACYLIFVKLEHPGAKSAKYKPQPCCRPGLTCDAGRCSRLSYFDALCREKGQTSSQTVGGSYPTKVDLHTIGNQNTQRPRIHRCTPLEHPAQTRVSHYAMVYV